MIQSQVRPIFKIITQKGTVTLRGPVKTDTEKKAIEEIALAVAGADKVDNQLEVNNDYSLIKATR